MASAAGGSGEATEKAAKAPGWAGWQRVAALLKQPLASAPRKSTILSFTPAKDQLSTSAGGRPASDDAVAEAAKAPGWAGWQRVAALLKQPPESCRTQWHAFCACAGHADWSDAEDAKLREVAERHQLRHVRDPACQLTAPCVWDCGKYCAYADCRCTARGVGPRRASPQTQSSSLQACRQPVRVGMYPCALLACARPLPPYHQVHVLLRVTACSLLPKY